jgi:hypothetical protein
MTARELAIMAGVWAVVMIAAGMHCPRPRELPMSKRIRYRRPRRHDLDGLGLTGRVGMGWPGGKCRDHRRAVSPAQRDGRSSGTRADEDTRASVGGTVREVEAWGPDPIEAEQGLPAERSCGGTAAVGQVLITRYPALTVAKGAASHDQETRRGPLRTATG